MERAEAIKIIRDTYHTEEEPKALETLIPELKESEDEQVRKAMLQHFKNKTKEKWCNIPVKDIISWLEKQKDHFRDDTKMVEQKPAEWSEEDEKNCNRIIRFLEPHKTFFPTKETKEEMQNWLKNKLKSLRPQSKIYYWTEEEIEPIISDYLIGREHFGGMIARLRCLKPRSHWKPSEEQMKALNALNLYGNISYVGQQNQLISLYQDLKKLM